MFFFYRASRYNRAKKNHLDAQHILSIFRQPLYVSGISRPIIRGYRLEFKPTRTTNSHLKRLISANCCIHKVVSPDDEPRHVRNLQRLTKYAKNKLCIKLVFLYAQLILSIFRQPLHVSGISRPIIVRYRLESNPTRTTNSRLKRLISTNWCA